eukprot:c25175_g1_i2 orf=158-2374(+)
MGGKPECHCRLWWPRHLSLRPPCRTVLLGWATYFSDSLDLVVATACCNDVNSLIAESLMQVTLNHATSRLPSELQKRATLCIIGECFPSSENYVEDLPRYLHSDAKFSTILQTTDEETERPVSNCYALQGQPECSQDGQNSVHIGNGGLAYSKNVKNVGEASKFRLKCHQKQQNGFSFGIEGTSEGFHLSSIHADTWVIIYEQPKFSSHHFSIHSWNFVSMTNVMENSCIWECGDHSTKPQWVAELEEQHKAPDINLVVLQLNCAVAAERAIEDLLGSFDTSCKRLFLSSILLYLYRHLVAATVAVPACIFYILVQAGSYTLKVWPFVLVNAICAKLAKHTWRTMHIRCHQLTGWPVMLLWRECGHDEPNMEAAHRAALVRHSAWSAIVFDLFFGLLVGVLLLAYRISISQWVLNMVQSLTDDILRTGCIWLMGVPAGFKLNTELAGFLGLLSLNVIQVWSTSMYFLMPAIGPFLCMLAISGMLLGITVLAAIVADVLFLATIHVYTLHQVVAFLYSNQLQALAALWRLFRGRKRNYLRGRIDTYDYSVEQHVVGSLMFTPLLLLLPTTSVFYIFFTILHTLLSMLRFLLQIFIACFHCCPFAQVSIWLVQPRRFPSGIWLKTLLPRRSPQPVPCSKAKSVSLQKYSYLDSNNLSSGNMLISSLDIKTASFGEILLPYLRQLGGGLTWSSCASFIYKIFSGDRWLSSVELGTAALPPWTSVSTRRFWWLCYEAVLTSI